MVAAVQVYRVNNPDGTTTDFPSLLEAVRYEVRTELLTRLAGLPENASEAQSAVVDSLLDDAERFHHLLGTFLTAKRQNEKARAVPQAVPVAAVPQPTAPAPRPAVVVRPDVVRPPRGGSRGPGFKTREVPLDGPGGAAWGEGRDE